MRGAYGLRLPGLESRFLGAVAPAWPAMSVSRRVVAEVAGAPSVDVREDRVVMGGQRVDVVVERTAGGLAAELRSTKHLTDDEVVHPSLAPAASAAAWWAGGIALHAGGFVHDGGAWAVVGGREAGKSSLMAALALEGVPVLADDALVVTPGGHACAGPRCVDLRPDAAAALGPPAAVMARDGSRQRLTLGPVEPETPLRGWLTLDWGGTTAVETLPAAARYGTLMRRRLWGFRPRDPRLVLELTALPALRLVRPRRWDATPDAIQALLAAARA